MKDLEGQLLEAQKTAKLNEKAQSDNTELKKNIGDLKKSITELKGELENAKKSNCPGQGVWSVPGNYIDQILF